MSREIWKIIIGIVALSMVFAQELSSSQVSSVLCQIVTGIKSVVTVIAVAMFVVGGVLYAVGNLLTGGMKQSAHGWAQGLIIGGLVGIVLVILAEPIVSTIAKLGGITGVSCQ
ncbi:MAG: hypothetical protein ACP5FX_00935 [Candidatus Micrarchaeia archaeon]